MQLEEYTHIYEKCFNVKSLSIPNANKIIANINNIFIAFQRIRGETHGKDCHPN